MIGETEGTTETGTAPWRLGQESAPDWVPHLVIAWASTPGRSGEVAALSRHAVLGRGAARTDDPAPRLRFTRQRPGVNQPTSTLDPERLSRLQLSLAPDGRGGVAFERLGKCGVLHNGLPADRGILRDGDIIALVDAVTLLVERRPKVMPEAWMAEPYRSTPFGQADPFGLVGESPYAWELRGRLAPLARGSDPSLLTGASGVGKELGARAIHGLSEAASGTLVSRNAATRPSSLIDAELFGTQRNYPNPGAAERPGLVGEAEGGTLFLDEIGELPREQQTHLLRLLDDGEYHRLGESRARRANVRLLGATNRDPDDLKHDFLARFAKRVDVKGLEARLSDVPLFVSAIVRDAACHVPAYARFLEQGIQADGTSAPQARLHPGLIDQLLRQDYSLHFRELRRLTTLALEGSDGDRLVQPKALARELKPLPQRVDLGAADLERALLACEGNVTQAARALGLPSRYSLYRLMKRFGVPIER
jgi:two-component system nitrogen regulation response regulator GlnG/two-component system response regulator HydG